MSVISAVVVLAGYIWMERWSILVTFGIIALLVTVLWLASYLNRVHDARHQNRAALIARADQQHAWVLAGDDRGVYGRYPPATIREVQTGTVAG